MSGLLGTVVDAAIGWLVQSILGSLFTEQMVAWTREIGLAEDVEKLGHEMRNVEMVLAAAEGRKIENMPLAKSLGHLKDLYDAEDIMEELDYYRLHQQIKEGKGITAATGTDDLGGSNVSSSSSTPSSAFEMICSGARQITSSSWASHNRKRKHGEEGPTNSTIQPLEIKHEISKRISGIVSHLCIIGNSVQRVLQLEISRPVAASSESQNIARIARLTTSVPVEDKVYGRDEERDKIIELLINGKSDDLNVLPVVGVGGFGKTTLARFVYCDERIKANFDLQMWVCVSNYFNEMKITLEILEHVCKDRQEYEKISNFNVLQEILLKNIRNKRFLLVLDDMWEDKDWNGWIKLLAPLKNNQVNGCMVLATTRMSSVAKMIGTMDEIRLSGLDEKEFWLFFKACAFGNENYEGQPSLQSIGKQIAKELKGCALAARSVGALLYTSVSIEHWRAVQDKWKSLQEEDGILTILKLSYVYLPVHLQQCFAFCSLYPEDHPFNGKNLIRTWISQNFVQCEDPTMRLEEIGQQYLDRLVDLGFFQKVGSFYVMHDLMHEMAGKVSSHECATIHGLKPETVRPSVRHLSIITTAFDKDEHSSFPGEKFDKILQKVRPFKKLRTLMLFGGSSINLLESVHTLCKEAKCLRFLRVCGTGTDISSILSLLNPCHIRYLEYVCVAKIDKYVYGVPYSIGLPQALTRFYNLQVLDVGILGKLAVPIDMNNLVNLRHLIAHEKVHHAIDCVGNMTSLQELKFKVQNVGGFEIGQLQSMNELVLLGISHLENVKSKEEAKGARLIDKEYLKKLSLSWEDSNTNLEHDTVKDVLEGLQPHQNLKTLEISGYAGSTSPTWLSNTFSVISVQILHLEKCREWQALPSLEMLPFLRKLTLIRMLNLKEILIPSLEKLVLIGMPKLEKCIGSYGMELTSRLRVLMIKNCPQLNEFTLFQSYSSFDAEQKSWFPSLSKLSIGQCPHIMNNWPILPLSEMKALNELELTDLHVVRVSVRPLERLVLTKLPSLEFCSGLTTQGDQMGWPSSLRSLTIHDCPCLIVSHPLPPSSLIYELSIRGVPRLAKMSIYHRQFTIESNELSVLDDSILAFHNLRGITLLEIRNCPNLASLSSEAFSQLIALEYLCILDCPNLTMSNSMSEVVRENSSSASSPVLPSIKHVHIVTCGVTGRWLTQLLSHSQSLEELLLTNCSQIKSLSIGQPGETEGTSSSASAVMTSAQDEHELSLPYNLLCSLKKLWIQSNLDLEFCGGMKDFAGFTSLVQLIIHGCPKLVSSMVERKDDGTMDVGLLPPSLEELDMGPLPENLQSFTPQGPLHLKRLWLSYGPCLKSVRLHPCKELLYSKMFSKLQQQEKCGNQIQLFPSSLKEVTIRALTDRVQPRLLTCLPTITDLKICESPELTSLQLGCCTALKALEIGDCNSLASIEGLQVFKNLVSLKVFNSPGLASCLELVSHQQGAPAIWSGLKTLEASDASVLSMPFCKQLTSLRWLRFGSMFSEWRGESMVSLTEEQERALQLLTSLEELYFFHCPSLLSLPASLHTLTSLRTLYIKRCQSITRLPDMGLPPSLRHLELFGCNEELGVQCRTAATEKLRVRVDY